MHALFVLLLGAGGGDDFFEGDIKLLGPSPYDTIVKRDADGSGDGGLASTPTDSDAEGYKSRTDLWEGGKVLYKFDTILSKLKGNSHYHACSS